MKYQMILLFLLINLSNSITAVAGKIWKSPEDIGFEFKNKGPGDILFSLYQIKPTKELLIKKQHLAPNQESFSKQLDITSQYELHVHYKTKKGISTLKRYQVKPGKTIFITWEDERIRPQRGKGICPARVSDSGFNLSRNVTMADVREVRNPVR